MRENVHVCTSFMDIFVCSHTCFSDAFDRCSVCTGTSFSSIPTVVCFCQFCSYLNRFLRVRFLEPQALFFPCHFKGLHPFAHRASFSGTPAVRCPTRCSVSEERLVVPSMPVSLSRFSQQWGGGGRRYHC